MVSVALTLLAHAMLLSLHLSNGSFPRPLSAKEERACVARMLEGDMDARNTLIEHNLRLVAHVVKKYYTRTEEQDDLVSIGTIGLIKGISSYRPEKGTRLATYAAKCIENAILSQRSRPAVECRSARLLCIIAALLVVSRLRPPVPASAPWSRAVSESISAPARTGTSPAPAQAPAVPALIWERSEILPRQPFLPEHFMLHSMCVFR